jgi:hypothetical protein
MNDSEKVRVSLGELKAAPLRGTTVVMAARIFFHYLKQKMLQLYGVTEVERRAFSRQ